MGTDTHILNTILSVRNQYNQNPKFVFKENIWVVLDKF